MFGGRYFGARYYGQRYYGKHGLVVDGAYNGSRYLGLHYFGARYFGTSYQNSPAPLAQTNVTALSGVLGVSGGLTFGRDFEVTQSGAIGLSASLTLTGALSYENEVWYFTPPVPVSGFSGALLVSGDITVTYPAPGFGGYFGRRFYGRRFYGPRYFGSPAGFPIAQSAGPGLTGALTLAGGFTTAIGSAQTNVTAMTGALSVAGDFTFDGGSRNYGGKVVAGPKKRNYIVQGQKYMDLTTEELARVVASIPRVKRKEIKVETSQKQKTIDSATWTEVKAPDDDEDVLLLL